MPRETLDINTFQSGLITELDQKDIPLDAGVDGTQNLSPNASGKLTGAGSPTEVFNDMGDNGKVFGWIERETGEQDLVMATGTSLKIIRDYYGTEEQFIDTSNAECIAVLNKSAYVGCGSDEASKWAGISDKVPFGSNNHAVQTYTGTGAIGSQNMIIDCEDYDDGATPIVIPPLQQFYFEITGTLGTDTFRYLGGTQGIWSGNIAITGGWQTLNSGVKVLFPDDGIYTTDDSWSVIIEDPKKPLVEDLVLSYKNIVDGDDWGIEISNITDGGGANGTFVAGQVCEYIISYTADNGEESILFEGASDSYTIAATPEDKLDIQVTIAYKGWDTLSKRIQYVTLWRRDNGGLARYVDRVSIDGSWSAKATSGSYLYHTYTFGDDGGNGETYEAYTGVPESLSSRGVDFKVNCVMNSSHFIGDCATELIDDASRIIFKSEVGTYGAFNVTQNLVKLSFIPKALAGFNGRIYAFDNNRFVRINPEGLYIEDTYDGAGCESQQGFVVTENGLFFANSTACYVYDGKELIDLSSKFIKARWQGETTTVMLTYDSHTKQVLFFRGNKCYAYHIEKHRWDYYTNPFTETVTGVFMDLNGHAICSLSNTPDEYLYQYFGSTAQRSWVWLSKELTFDDDSQDKKFYKIEIKGAYDNAYFNTTGSTPTTAIASLNKNKAETIRLKIAGSTTDTVTAVSIIYRRMVGKR